MITKAFPNPPGMLRGKAVAAIMRGEGRMGGVLCVRLSRLVPD